MVILTGTGGITSLDGTSGGRVTCIVGNAGIDDTGGNPGKAGICGLTNEKELIGSAGMVILTGTGGVTSLDGTSGGRVTCIAGNAGIDDTGGNPGKAGI